MAVVLRLLFWLKWKLLLRNYQRSMSAVVGAILAVLFLLPMSLGIALLSGLGFFYLRPEAAENLLRAVVSLRLSVRLFEGQSGPRFATTPSRRQQSYRSCPKWWCSWQEQGRERARSL